MRDFSTKPKVEQIEVSVDGSPVFLRPLTAGDKIKLSALQGELASSAAAIRAKAESGDADDIGQVAASSLSKDQYRAWIEYMNEYVFLRWSNSDGQRKFTDRRKFNDLPSEIIEAIYVEASKLAGEESAEAAEKNS